MADQWEPVQGITYIQKKLETVDQANNEVELTPMPDFKQQVTRMLAKQHHTSC